MNVKTAIELGDAAALRAILAADAAKADERIVWGRREELATHPLHYVSDKVFDGTLKAGAEMVLIEALLDAGANVNYQAANGETALIGAASLGAEEVGIRLLEAGADHTRTAIWNATALHWAAFMGLDALVAALLAKGAATDGKDSRYDGTPAAWAEHASRNPPKGGKNKHAEVLGLLS